jgi:phosphorylcholine metabolism protein LicD
MIVNLLISMKIENWFIGYGTLLGIIRDESCIEGDDDIDIIVDEIHIP